MFGGLLMTPTDGMTKTCLLPTASWTQVTQHWKAHSSHWLRWPLSPANPTQMNSSPFLFHNGSGPCSFLPTLSAASLHWPPVPPRIHLPYTWLASELCNHPFKVSNSPAQRLIMLSHSCQHSLVSKTFHKPRRA